MQMNFDVVDTPPIPAATVVILRNAPQGMETFLLRRHGAAAVLGGAHVFPGGKVDPSDADAGLHTRLDQAPAALAARLNEPATAAPDAAALFVFVIEYGLRAMLAERPTNYLFSFWGLIDFLAIVPAIAFSGSGSYVFRSFRLLRIIRILKLARYSKALQKLARAFSSIRDDLAVFCFLSLIIFFVAASGIYYFENEAQPDKFSSIPASMWWAISTLTTVGYGDVYPVTAGGKLFTVFILMVGLGLVAVPVGLIASALTRDEEESD